MKKSVTKAEIKQKIEELKKRIPTEGDSTKVVMYKKRITALSKALSDGIENIEESVYDSQSLDLSINEAILYGKLETLPLTAEINPKNFETEALRAFKSISMTTSQIFCTNQVRENIGRVINNINIDICFLIDGTGSMATWIDRIKVRVNEIVKFLLDEFKESKIKIGCVVYRDFDMGKNSFEILDLTEDVNQVENFLKKIKATGGKDGPEDINGGLQKIISEIKWSGDARLILHIADAPCHGSSDFHDLEDNYSDPESDLDWIEIFEKMQELNLWYSFMKLNDSTLKMIKMFKESWIVAGKNSKIGGNPIVTEGFITIDSNCDPKTFFDEVVKAVLDGVRSSLKSSGRLTQASSEKDVSKGEILMSNLMYQMLNSTDSKN